MVQIKLTEKASSDLKTIHEYIAKVSKIYAARFIKSLIGATIKFETIPYCGNIVPNSRI